MSPSIADSQSSDSGKEMKNFWVEAPNQAQGRAMHLCDGSVNGGLEELSLSLGMDGPGRLTQLSQ